MRNLIIRWSQPAVRQLARAFFATERLLCRIPGFMMEYGRAGDEWSAAIDERAARINADIDTELWDLRQRNR